MSLPLPERAPLTHVSRRGILKLGAIGLTGVSASLAAATGGGEFTHGVASGEPGPQQVLLWTRYGASADTRLVWEVAEDTEFAKVVAAGDVIASPANDGCVKAWVRGLAPGKWYYYRFVAPSGARSVIGRTRTLPVGRVPRFRMAVFSCSNYGFGWFNAYAHAAENADFDLALHLGDYFYEYQRGTYPTAKQTQPGRILPVTEAVTLAEYRERLATYRSDPDLQRIHQILPMVVMWDDHESANDAWQNGAENHQPGEGDWAVRKAASHRAWREWMPVSDDDWAAYEIGNLATIFKLETRHTARTRPLDLQAAFRSAAPEQTDAALTALRDGAWRDPARTLLGTTQEAWLAAGLKASTRARKPWQVLAQQIIMGSLSMGAEVAEGMSSAAPDWLKQRIQASVAGSKLGLPLNMDAWDGYPAARERVFGAALAADANLLVLAGDSHNAWAFDLDHKGARVGVEMAGHSVTSPGSESSVAWKQPADLARIAVQTNPQLQWCDTAQRGYMAVELTPTAAHSEWRFLQTVRQRGTALAGSKRMTVLAGQRKFQGS
ncbi:alkaline phosphatase [Novosphingobium sp.]|uniref:alkaline phosphatase D family protein n=1 Tax=Novosphingobium sp. TaxID=1874826 RepID=UPI002736B221|nr:alkaline phosphatase D family protein [Novosphingobium sp.]MDP3906450.1 alkaline phosphatase D family protein [Novosphingobium sp.]